MKTKFQYLNDSEIIVKASIRQFYVFKIEDLKEYFSDMFGEEDDYGDEITFDPSMIDCGMLDEAGADYQPTILTYPKELNGPTYNASIEEVLSLQSPPKAKETSTMTYQITTTEVLSRGFGAAGNYEAIKDLVSGGNSLTLSEACEAQVESESDFSFDEDRFDAIFDKEWAAKEYAKMWLAEAEYDSAVQGGANRVPVLCDGTLD
jgi:hypothetical protein